MKHLSIIFFLVVMMASCKQEVSDEFHPYTNSSLNDTVWTRATLTTGCTDSISNAVKNNTQTFIDSFVVSGGKIRLNDSMEISFPPNAASYPNGTPVADGKIGVSILSLKTKGDYVRYLVPTTNNKYPLESDGSFFIKLTKNGQDVNLSNGTYFDLTVRNNNPRTDMKFFGGTPSTNTDSLLNWALVTTGVVKTYDSSVTVPAVPGKKGYDIKAYNRLGWFSCANFLDTTVARTRLNVTLPLNYTNKNTIVFAVYKDKKTVMRLTADYATRSFFTQNVAINTNLTLIAISLIDNTFYLGTRNVTVANTDRFSIIPTISSITNISNLLDNL